MYLYNKNILEYVEIVGTEPKSMIMKVTLYIILASCVQKAYYWRFPVGQKVNVLLFYGKLNVDVT